MSTYDAIATTVGFVLGGSATAAMLWAALHDDGHDATGELDGFGVPVEPNDRDDDQLARIALGARYTDRTVPSGVVPLWR